MKNLNQYGAGCRCLLRARENLGLPVLSDQSFLRKYQDQFPNWLERPGETDASALCDLAKFLNLATTIDVIRDYDEVTISHLQGHVILVSTERAPESRGHDPLVVQKYVTLLATIETEQFSLWCPFPSGLEAPLVPAAREWWDKWLCTAWVLRQEKVALLASVLPRESLVKELTS